MKTPTLHHGDSKSCCDVIFERHGGAWKVTAEPRPPFQGKPLSAVFTKEQIELSMRHVDGQNEFSLLVCGVTVHLPAKNVRKKMKDVEQAEAEIAQQLGPFYQERKKKRKQRQQKFAEAA